MPIDARMVKWESDSAETPSIDPRMIAWEEAKKTPLENISGRVSNLFEGAGIGLKAPVVGIGNLLGKYSDEEVKAYKQQAAENSAKPGGFGGQILGGAAPAAALSFMPGGNTLAGAAAYNGMYGATMPAESMQERGVNALAGAAGGLGGQLLGQGIKAATKPFLTAAERKVASDASLHSMKNDAVFAAKESGYALPRSEYNPTFLSNRLESIGGKAAIKQEAVSRNQEVTNKLVKQSLGIADDQPLSMKNIEAVRESAYAPYREIAALPPSNPNTALMLGGKKFDPAKTLEELKQARHDAKAQFEFYNRSADPDVLKKAKALDSTAEKLEKDLGDYAVSLGRDDLVPALQEARKTIAKTYTVERAVNKTTGDVDARIFGRLFDKQKPLSDGLEKVGQFAAGFPKYAGYGPTNPAAGVGKTEAIASTMLGAGGAAATGSPVGLLAAGIPLLSHPARALSLSKVMQKTPSYGPGFVPRLPGIVANVMPAGGGVGLLNYMNEK